MSSFEDLDDLIGASRVFFLDTNLSSPVLYTEIEETRLLINQVRLKTENSKKYNEEVSFYQRSRVNFLHKLCLTRGWTIKTLKSFQILLPSKYERFEQSILENSIRGKNLVYEQAQLAAQELEDSLVCGLLARGLPAEEIRGTASTLGTYDCLYYRAAYEQFCDLFSIAESRVKTSPDTWTLGSIGSVNIWISSRHALISFDNQFYYSSLNQVLMLKDKLATRYMMLEHVKPLGLDPSLTSNLLSLFSWQDQTLSIYGNQAYNLLKAVEPMFKTWLSHSVDNVFGTDTAYTRMIKKMQQKEIAVANVCRTKNHNVIFRLCLLVESITSIRSIVEMFGTLKSCGHPLIDAELGGLSASEAARSPDKTSLVDAQNLRNTLCHVILTSYISQHGSWPKLFHSSPNTRLKKHNDRQTRNLTRHSYPLSDWNTTEWTKIFDFDYFPNFLDLMDDKSISLYKSDKHLTWDKGRKPKTNRRLLLECLSKSEINVEEIVKRVSTRNIPEDWKIVSLYPKEREFKLEPRMFAMLVLEMRCFFTAIEANIADNVFKYLPQQTMTKTKTQNQERFLKFTDPQKNKIDYSLFLEIDLTRWNLKWREMVIHMLGHDFNCMFGVKGTFTVTHWFFTIAQIVVRVSGLRPDGIELDKPPQSNLCWTNHLGGFEGLNQKLWTAATYAMVEMALAPLLDKNIISDYEVIGQGDNQVVRVSIPNKDREREDIIPGVRDLVNEALETTCSSVNQEVKPEENIESTSVLTYSKDVLVRGVEYPTSLKKHSRLFPVTSMDFPSVSSNARAILAGAIAGGENSLYPLRSAIIGHYHAYRYVLSASNGYSIHSSGFPKMSHRSIQASLVIPSSLGGLCGPAYASYFYKGGSDPLGKEVSGLRFLAHGSTIISKLASSTLRGLEERYMIEESPNADVLLDNPYGLPLQSIASPLSKVGQLTLEAFRGQVRNKDIHSLLRKKVEISEKTLRSDLISMRPLNPILAHDMFDASGFGSIKLMRKMFIHTRTIQTVAQANNPLITHTFLRADMNDVKRFLSWLKGLPDNNYSGKRSYDLVHKFRSYWNIDLHGVTNHQPLDFIHYAYPNHRDSSLIWSSHSNTNLLDTRGPLTGYIGTATREKRSEHGYKIVNTGTPSRALMKLQLIRSQAYGNKNFNDLLDQISLTRSPIALSRVTDILPKIIGGSISHRYSSTIRSMSASYVGPLNFATHIRIDTDNIAQISGSAFNYPVMLQEFIIMTQTGAKMKYIHEGINAGGLHLPFDDLTALEDDAMSCPRTSFIHTGIPKSKLSYSTTLSVKRTFDTEAGGVPAKQVVPSTDYESHKCIKLSLIGFFMTTLRDQNRAKIIADNRGHVSLPARYQLDIAEAHALGPNTIVSAISVAIVLTTIRDTFRTLQLHPERWDEGMFMAHNIQVCLKTVSSYLNHPLFYTHRDYSKFKFTALKYSKSMTLLGRLTAAVRREISDILSRPSHEFWNLDIPVFAAESKGILTEAVVLAAAKKIRELFLIHHPNRVLFSNLFSSYLKVPRKIADNTGETLELIRLRFNQLSVVYKRQGDILLAESFLKLSHLIGVKVFNDDQRTVLRHARSLKPDTILRPTFAVRSLLPKQSSPVSHCSRCTPSAQSINSLMWDKYKIRRNGGLSAAGYTWLHVLPEVKVTKCCLVVGNGNGGLADLLLSCYNTDVIGLDLEVDMPRDSATLLNYIPIGVEPERRDRFIQSDWSINSSGDWLRDDVRRSVLDSLPALSTIFVDMTGPEAENIVQSIGMTMDHRLVSSCYCRLIGPVEDVWKSVGMLSEKYVEQTWVVSHSHSSIEVISHISRSSQYIHHCSYAKDLIHLPISDELHSLIPERRNELLEAATLSTFAWNGETPIEAYSILRRLSLSLLNKPKSTQLLHGNRINLLIGYATLYAVCVPDPISLLQDWIADEKIETDLFTYGTNAWTVTHLLRYVSRLTGSVYKSLIPS